MSRINIQGRPRVDLGEFTLAILEDKNKKFEILVHPQETYEFIEKVNELRNKRAETNPESIIEHKIFDLVNIVESPSIFTDLTKGERPSEEELMEYFGTENFEKNCIEILLNGRIHFSKKQRKERLKRKREHIIEHLLRKTVNPKTNRPYSRKKLKWAFSKAKIDIEPVTPIDQQEHSILKEVHKYLPIELAQKAHGTVPL